MEGGYVEPICRLEVVPCSHRNPDQLEIILGPVVKAPGPFFFLIAVGGSTHGRWYSRFWRV